MAKKVFLDPGHGGSDPGAVGNGLREKDLTLAIAKATEKYLKNYEGVSIKLSRTETPIPPCLLVRRRRMTGVLITSSPFTSTWRRNGLRILHLQWDRLQQNEGIPEESPSNHRRWHRMDRPGDEAG